MEKVKAPVPSSSDAEASPLLQRCRISMESKRVRFLPMLELLLPTAVICALMWIGDRASNPSFYQYLKNDQATIQVVVQVVSHALAILQVSSMCATFNLSTRLRLLHRSTSLQDLSLWIALSTARVDLNLPAFYFAIASTFVAATLIPGALWAGAISPLFVLKTQELGDQLLPAFTNRTRAIWDAQFQMRGPQLWNINDNCTVINDATGLVPTCPVPTLQGLLLLSASSATTLDGSSRNNSKLDSPSWKYISRSFGMGSSVGRSNDNIADDRVLYYTYTEFGYVANVSCIKNSTSDFRMRLVEYVDRSVSVVKYQEEHHHLELEVDPFLPEISLVLATYLADGYLPNSIMGAPSMYPVISWNKEYKDIAAWATEVNDNRNLIAIAAGTNLYYELHQTQCEVFFTPMTFNVTVNRSQQLIAVEAQSSAEAQDIDPTGHLRANVMHSINLLARMSPSLYVSVLGESLNRNVERMRKQKPHLNVTEAVTSAVAESFTAIIDDILVAYGASQISNAHDTTLSAAHGVVEAVRIGQPRYRYLVFAMNSLMLLFVACEALRTGCWRRLTKFNYLDIKSIVIASSAGGSGIAKAVWDKHRAKGTHWDADPCDPVARAMRFKWDSQCVVDDTETMAIVKSKDYDDCADEKSAGHRRNVSKGAH